MDVIISRRLSIVVSPELVEPYLRAYDRATSHVGGIRNKAKTVVTYLATDQQLRQRMGNMEVHQQRQL